MTPERRLFERCRPEENFLVEFQSENFSKPCLGQGKDLSAGGLRFATSVKAKKGDFLNLTFYFPKHYPGLRKTVATVLVRRAYQPGPTHRYRVACEFMELQPAARQAITNFMHWNLSLSLTPSS